MLPAHIFPTRSPVEDIGLIRVFHPGYDDDCSLIEFDGYDDENGGIWREVVVTACAIISNNRFNGQLRDRAGNTQNMDILPAGDYTWHVPGDGRDFETMPGHADMGYRCVRHNPVLSRLEDAVCGSKCMENDFDLLHGHRLLSSSAKPSC